MSSVVTDESAEGVDDAALADVEAEGEATVSFGGNVCEG